MAEQLGSKLKFDTTGLGKTTHKGYIKSGVVNNSKAIDTATDFNFATGVAKAGLDTAMDIKEASVLEEIRGQVEGLSQEVADRSLEGQATFAEGIVNDQALIGDAKESAGYDGTYPTALNTNLHQDITGIQGQLQTKIDKLTRAKNQGVMSEFELSQRLAAITKEAVTNNPYYTNEIIAQASQTASLNNITARVKHDTSILEDQVALDAAANKKLVTEALKHDVDIYNPDGRYQDANGNMDSAAVALELTKRQQKKSTYTQYKIHNDTNTEIKGMNTEQLLDSGQPYLLNDAVVFGSDARMNEVLAGKGSPDEKQRIIERIAQEELSDLNGFYIKQGARLDDPRVKSYLESAKARMDSMKKTYIDSITGKINADTAKNELDYIVNSEAQNLYKNNPGLSTDLTIINAIKGFSPAVGYADKIQVEKRIIETLNRTPASNADTKNRDVNKSFEIPKGSSIKLSPISQVTNSSAETVLSQNDDLSKEIFEDNLESRVAYQSNTGKYVESNTQDLDYQSLIKDLNKPQVVEAYAKLENPQLTQSLVDTIDSKDTVMQNAYKRYKEISKGKRLVTFGDSLVVKDATFKDMPFINNDLKTINENAKAWTMLSGKPAQEYFDKVMGIETKEA